MKNYPFIRYSLVFISGILINNLLRINSHLLLPILIVFLLISVVGYFSKGRKIFRIISTITFLLLFFLLGSYLHSIKVENKALLPDGIKNIEKLVVIGSVQSIELTKIDELSFKIFTDSVRINSLYHAKKLSLICKVRDDSQAIDKLYNRILPGFKVRIEGSFQRGREARNPGEFNYDDYLRAKGISGLFYIKDQYEVKIIDWNSSVFRTAIFKARKYVGSKINNLHNEQTSGLLRGLLLADRSNIDYQTKTEFVNSGVMHILAVSGLHVGYIVLIFIVVLGRFNIYTRSILTVAGLIAFLLLTGMPASVFRAVTMAVVIIFAFMTNRSSSIYNSLSIAAFIVLVFNPEDLFSPGFQLSFLAVLSIAIIYPILQNYVYSLKLKSKIINYILLFMGVSLSAQLGTLPLTLMYFGKLSLVSLLTNLIVIPLVGAIVGIAIFTLVLSLFISSVALIYSSANNILVYGLFKIISFAGTFQYSYLPIKNFTDFDSVIFYASIVLIILFLLNFHSLKSKLAASILVILIAVVFSSFDNKNLLRSGQLSVMMIDVNQGDATLIKFPNGETALIDGGFASFFFDNGDRIIKPLLNYLDVDKIDYAIVSSMTQESFGGFVSLMKAGVIKNIIKPVVDSNFIVDIQFERLVHEHKIPIRYYNEDILRIGEVNLYFLSDGKSTSSAEMGDDRNIIIKLIYGKTSFLFPGKIKHDDEYYYCDKYKDFLKSNVLKVSNNGRINSTSLEFLQKVQPDICLIGSENQNKFGTTSPFIQERLEKIEAQICRTDEDGAILLKSDGVKISRVNWK